MHALDLTEVVHDLDDVQVTQGELAIVEALKDQLVSTPGHVAHLLDGALELGVAHSAHVSSRAQLLTEDPLKESLDRNGQADASLVEFFGIRVFVPKHAHRRLASLLNSGTDRTRARRGERAGCNRHEPVQPGPSRCCFVDRSPPERSHWEM